jgi:hypothetical protein
MPLILSIRAVLDRHKKQMDGNLEIFPLVVPRFGYYISKVFECEYNEGIIYV